MRSDVHAAALRSAAKLVLGMASFAVITTGCSSESTDDTGSSTDAVITKDTDKTATNDSLLEPGTTGGETTAECKTKLTAAFPTGGQYGQTSAQPADVIACCDQELSKHGSMTGFRWGCCFAYDENAKVDPGNDGEVNEWDVPTLSSHAPGFACTPWGPPVPPSMRRSTKMSPARRDMNRFLVSRIEMKLARQAA